MIEDDDFTPDGSDVLRAAALRGSVAAEAARFLTMAALAGVEIGRVGALDTDAERA